MNTENNEHEFFDTCCPFYELNELILILEDIHKGGSGVFNLPKALLTLAREIEKLKNL